MAEDMLKSKVKSEVRRRAWASQRGKATRKFIRENPAVQEEFDKTSTIKDRKFPKHVTRASVLLELRLKASRREASAAVKQWREENPEEWEKLKKAQREGSGDGV